MKKYSHLIKKTFMSDDKVVLRSQMILCALATSIPLFIGLYFQQLPVAIYGGLTGYFLTVFDQQGTFIHRLQANTVSYLMLVLGFIAGLHFQQHPYELLIILGIMAYWVGVMGGEGAELEQAALFTTIQILIAANSVYIGSEAASYVLMYSLISYAIVIITTVCYFTMNKKVASVPSLLTSFKRPLISELELHLHAISYSVTALLSTCLMQYWSIERGYWAVVTVLLILKPDRMQSLYRNIQRIVGTCLGALVCIGIVYFIPHVLSMIIIIACCAGFVPWAMKRNYWFVSFLISIIVLLLLELPAAHHGEIGTPVIRLKATIYGSILSLFGVALSKLLDVFFIGRKKCQ
ncbi:FUSC family protein [uncultured Legionella sp.]|uniref:FUSC family protein n=1 Tax=uncultured Legionella sp. TaxID=210934 RepID=UPI0026177E0F|nr:FUSC family protein [uncultured Legionella sp.]